MIKAVIFFRRRAGMAREAFHEHWRTRHAELIVHLPGIRGYVQNTPVDPQAPYDAVAESSFDDTGAMKALARSPEYAAVLADEPGFIEAASMGSIITEEHVLKDGPVPAGAVKVITLVRRAAGTPLDAFFQSFLEEGRRAARAPGTLRYAQCHTRRPAYDSGRTPACDGAAMAWLERAADAARHPCAMVVGERIVL